MKFIEEELKDNNCCKINFKFIDTIRFIAMAAIVYEHTSLFSEIFLLKKGNLNIFESVFTALYINAGKFGTIIFFLISGFLINSKNNEHSVTIYLKRRLNSIIKPWFIFSSLYFILIFSRDFIKHKIGRGDIQYDNLYSFLFSKLTETIFYSSYWFVPNLLISICLLFMFKKHLYKISTGLIFGLFTILYSVNIYFKIIPTGHTTAIFGFVFFLWLGVLLRQNFSVFQNWIAKTSSFFLGFLCVLSLYLSTIESVYLIQIGSKDPFNTLRITNIIFSLSSFLLLYKIGDIKIINKLKPRDFTFGIYLIHMVLIIILIPVIFGPFNSNGGLPILALSINQDILLSLLRFVIIYIASCVLVRLIAKTKFCWIFGIKNKTLTATTPSNAESVPHFESAPAPIDQQKMLLPD